PPSSLLFLKQNFRQKAPPAAFRWNSSFGDGRGGCVLRFAGGTPAPTDSGALQIPGSISGESGGASAASGLVARQRKTASAETRTSANQMRRKVMKCWRVNVS